MRRGPGLRRIAAVALLCAAGCASPGDAPFEASSAGLRRSPAKFAAEPRVRRVPGGVRIDFAADRPVDAAVSVEDSRGRVVRHLAAGLLGSTAPPPFRGASMEQSLLWDGRDDEGRDVLSGTPPGTFTVRVALGLKPTFEKLLGSNPAHCGGIRGLAPGPDGRLYVFHGYGGNHPLDSATGICVFSRKGRYLKTIMPYPGGLSDRQLAGLRTVKHSTGRSPYIYQFETRSFLPGLGDLPTQRPVVTADGRLAFAGILEGPRYSANPDQARLVVMRTDGSVPLPPLRAHLATATDTASSLALSADEKTIYATGLRRGPSAVKPVGPEPEGYEYGRTWKWTRPVHAVYVMGWNDRRPRLFAGDPRRAGDRPGELDTPLSVAVGPGGSVYVAEWGNDRVSVFSAAGKFLGSLPVASPQRVEVSRKTGAVYILSKQSEKKTEVLDLIKFDGWRTAREVTRTTVYRSRWGSIPIRRRTIALDESAEPTVVWFGGPLMRIEDRGDSFSEPLKLYPEKWLAGDCVSSVMDMSMDRRRGWLYVNNRWRYGTRTGEWESFRTQGGRMWPYANPGSANGSAGRDGYYYVDLAARSPRILRYDADMMPAPFLTAEQNANRPWLEKADACLRAFARNRGRGLTADHRGNVYAILKKCGAESQPDDYHRANALYVFSPTGEVLKRRLVDAQIPNINHPRVDFAGNIYLAVGLRPGRSTLPPGLEGRVPSRRRDPASVNGVNAYPLIYGSIVKFGPEGGRIRVDAGERDCNYAYGRRIQVSGARWIFPGCSLAGSWATPKKRDPLMINVCMCESPCIDVDGFGRAFFPDVGRSRVGVLDTAGNCIAWFGTYGNADSPSAPPDPAAATPVPTQIPLCWPQAVAVDDTHVYVGDRVNRRIVCVRLDHEVQRTIPVDPSP